MKILRIAICLLVSGLLLAACVPAEPAGESERETEMGETGKPEPIRLSIATSAAMSSASGSMMIQCIEDWEQEMQGRVELEIYGDSRLGDDALLLRAVTRGTVSIVLVDISLFAEVVPEAALAGIPMTFDSLEEYNERMGGAYGEVFGEYFEQQGLKLLGTYARSWKYVSSNVSLEGAEDVKKMRIRLIDNPLQQLFWETCGAETGTQAFSELYMALKNDRFNSQENSLDAFYTNKFYEVQDHLLDARLIPTAHGIVMDLEQYQALPEDVQLGLKECLRRSSMLSLEANESLTQRYRQELENSHGVSIREITPEMTELFRKGREAVIGYLKETLGEDVVEEYLEAMKL